MADVSKFIIDGTTYNVKDTTARGSISTIEQKNESQDTKITQLESTVGGHSTKISTMEGDIAELQANQAYKPTYADETITLSPAK